MTCKVLFVDESKIEIRVFIRSLMARGYEVDHCRFAEEAFELLQERRVYDCVLVDVLLAPGLHSTSFTGDAPGKNTEAGIDLVEKLIAAQTEDPALHGPTTFAFLSHMSRSRSHARLKKLEALGVRYMRKADLAEDPARFVANVEEICRNE